jgi:hypothetical protein
VGTLGFTVKLAGKKIGCQGRERGICWKGIGGMGKLRGSEGKKGAGKEEKGATSSNRTVRAPPPMRAAPGFRLARSVGLRPHSHANLHPHFGRAGKPAVCLFALPKRRVQPERYVP